MVAAGNSVDLTLTGRVETAEAPYSDYGGYVIRADALGPVLAVLDDPNNRIGGLLPAMNTLHGELQVTRTDDDLPVILVRTRKVGTSHGDQTATWSRCLSFDGIFPLRSIPQISRRLVSTTSPTIDNDTDDDGVPNSYEIAVGSDPNVPDANVDHDGDGATLIEEYLAGTLDNDPSSRLRITTITPAVDGWTVSWQSVAGKSYQLASTGNLDSPFSLVPDTLTTATTSTSSVTVTWPITRRSFFRIQLITNP